MGRGIAGAVERRVTADSGQVLVFEHTFQTYGSKTST